MSKIGKKPIAISDKVQVELVDTLVKVKGPKGELELNIPTTKVTIEKKDNVILVHRNGEDKEAKARHGLYNTLIRNMVSGVTEGYEKNLELVGVGYRAMKKGNGITLALGFSHPIIIEAIEGITFELQGDTKITVKGIDKQLVGQVAANIRKLRPPEPYKGKGVKYAGEHIVRKAGKAAK